MEGGDLAAAAGGGGGAGEEKYSWVPVRVARLTYLLNYLGAAVHRSRWQGHREEREWVERAEAMGPDDADAERQLKLARDLYSVMSNTWYSLACMLHDMMENVAEAVDLGGEQRSRPESAAWWRSGYTDDDMLHGSHGFVHLTRDQAARVRALVADAFARTQLIRVARDDLSLALAGAGAGDAGVYSTPALLARMRRAQHLADAILLPLHELSRLVDYLMEVNSNNLRGRGGRERRRRRSAPPSRRTPATEPMLRRSASVSSLRLSSSYPL